MAHLSHTVVSMDRIYKVLLVDDEPEVLMALHRTLRSEGWEIDTASNPEEALDVLKTKAIDVVISDHDMPGMQGLELMQRIRLSSPGIVRILLTGRSDVDLAIRALNEGAVHKFLLKPWDRVDLRGMVRLALRNSESNLSPPASRPEQPL